MKKECQYNVLWPSHGESEEIEYSPDEIKIVIEDIVSALLERLLNDEKINHELSSYLMTGKGNLNKLTINNPPLPGFEFGIRIMAQPPGKLSKGALRFDLHYSPDRNIGEGWLAEEKIREDKKKCYWCKNELGNPYHVLNYDGLSYEACSEKCFNYIHFTVLPNWTHEEKKRFPHYGKGEFLLKANIRIK